MPWLSPGNKNARRRVDPLVLISVAGAGLVVAAIAIAAQYKDALLPASVATLIEGAAVQPVANPPMPASNQAGPVVGETYLWRPVAIGGGGFITGYDADPTGEVRLARTDVHGAYIWLADQDRWGATYHFGGHATG